MDVTDYSEIEFWWNALQTVVLLFVAVYTWLVNRTKANRAAISATNDKMDGLHSRVTVLENELGHVPGDEEVARIHSRIDQVAQGVQRLEGEMKHINQTLTMIQQYLLEKKP